MGVRRRSSIAVRIALSVAVLAVAVTAVVLGVVGVFQHGRSATPCPAAQATPGPKPCVAPAG